MRYFWLLILCFITPSVYAEVNLANLFNIPVTDRSITYLGQIFGGNIGPLTLSDGTGLNAIVSQIFANLNAIVLAIGVCFVSYIGVLSTINTAHEGEMMGKKFSSIWIPIRASLGMLMMVPTPGTGYSLVQVSLMWIVMQGVGAADTLWNVVIDQLLSGQSVSSGIQTFAPTFIDPAQRDVLYSSVCMDYLNNNPNMITNNMGPIVVNGPTVDYPNRYKNCGAPGSGSWLITVGPANAAGTPYDAICGYYCNNETNNFAKQTSKTQTNIGTADSMALAKSQAMMGLFSAMSQLAKDVVANKPITAGSATLGYAAYLSAVSSLYQTSDGDVDNQNLLKAASSAGWIHAGSYYALMAQGSASLIDQAKPDYLVADNWVPRPPTLAGNAAPGLASTPQSNAFIPDIGPLTNYMNIALAKYNQDAHVPNINLGSAQLPGLSGVSDSLGAIGSLVGNGLSTLMHLGPNDGDPLTTMAAFGGQLMAAGEAGWLLSVTVAILAMVGGAWCTAESPGAAILDAVLSLIFPWVTLVFVGCYTAGASMAVYMPMIPYFIFSTSAIGWMMSVIEAMVGAPLVALALVHPSGDELGKANHGLMLLANIFLRPMLMILGFIFASRVLRTSLYLVNYGFNAAFGSGVVEVGGTSGVMGWAVPLIVYCGFVTAIISRCFTLIYVVPDKIMRWLGGSSEDTGAMVSETVSQTKGSVDKGMESANKVQGGISDGVGAGQSMAKGTRKPKEEKKKK